MSYRVPKRPILTRADWAEVYYALRDKLDNAAVVKGTDTEAVTWRAHLADILQTLGPDGQYMCDEVNGPAYVVCYVVPVNGVDECRVDVCGPFATPADAEHARGVVARAVQLSDGAPDTTVTVQRIEEAPEGAHAAALSRVEYDATLSNWESEIASVAVRFVNGGPCEPRRSLERVVEEFEAWKATHYVPGEE